MEDQIPRLGDPRAKGDIFSFAQRETETLHDTLERYKSILGESPYQELPAWLQVEQFYQGLKPPSRRLIDHAARGSIYNMSPEEAIPFIEDLAMRDYYHQGQGQKHQLAQVSNHEENEWDQEESCPMDFEEETQVEPKRREPMLQEVNGSIQRMESYLQQIAIEVANWSIDTAECAPEDEESSQAQAITLRSGKEVGLREERSNEETSQLNGESAAPNEERDHITKQKREEQEQFSVRKGENIEATPRQEANKEKKNKTPAYKPPIPYPARLRKEKDEEQFGKFLELFKQLHINIPLVEALSQMPKYAKFLKDLLSNKRKLEEVSMVELNKKCSSFFKDVLPEKKKDPGSFTIPCLIGSTLIKNALADLGASINLMPYSLFKKLDIGEPKPTRMSIQLADRSIRYPKGIIEDMLVKVDKFIFPVDFVIFDMEEDVEVPLILGRPFLATASANIDVKNSNLKLSVGDEEVTIHMNKAMQNMKEQDDTCYNVDILDSLHNEFLQELSQESTKDNGIMKEAEALDEPKLSDPDRFEGTKSQGTESINEEMRKKLKPSIEEPPVLELKLLPVHLEYAFLGENETLPVIISSALTKDQKDKLLKVLKKHKRAIAWKISDIKGINPSYCTHSKMHDGYI